MASQRASAALNESQTYLKASILPTDFLSEKASDIFGVMEWNTLNPRLFSASYSDGDRTT